MLFTKHIHVLHLISTIPGPKKILVNGYMQNTDSMTKDEANTAWDILFDYIHRHWETPLSYGNRYGRSASAAEQAEVLDCQAMLDMDTKNLEEKLATLPPYFTEVVFPVAVARYILRDLQMPFNHRNCRTFKEFHDRYGYMILAG